MALFGRRLATEKNGRNSEQRLLERILDPSLGKKREKLRFVLCPGSFFLFILVKHILGWCQQQLMPIFDTADFFQEKTASPVFWQSLPIVKCC